MTITSKRHIPIPLLLFSSIFFLPFFLSFPPPLPLSPPLPPFVNPLFIPVSVARRWLMTETGYDSSPNKRKASRRARGMVERFAKRRLPGTHRGMERMEAIPLWHGRGISRDLIERLRIFESIRRCVNSGSVSPAQHTSVFLDTGAREGEGERSDMVGRGRLKYLRARARAYRFGQPRFFLFFFFFWYAWRA